jgi:hypothetical protein
MIRANIGSQIKKKKKKQQQQYQRERKPNMKIGIITALLYN